MWEIPTYMRNVVIKYSTSFSLQQDGQRSRCLSVKTEELEVQFVGRVAVQPTQSVWTIAEEVGSSKSTLHEILKTKIPCL